MQIETVNPATEMVLNSYAMLTSQQIDTKITAAHATYLSWRKEHFSHRKQLMLQIAKLLRKHQNEYAILMAQEMGKPIAAGKGEIEKCAWVCEHYAHEAEHYLASRNITTEMKKTTVSHHPIGIIFAIMPWNYPFWQVFRFAAPTIMAGNAAILKHAPISTGTGNTIEALFLEAGFPEHLFQHFVLDNDSAANVIAHQKIAAVTLTGSERAGSAVAANASSHLKKAVLELGGNDAYIVLEDADLDLAAKSIITSRFSNTGQACIAAKRIIAIKSIIEELTQKLLEGSQTYQMGDPLQEDTNFGPMARKDLRDNLQKQVMNSRKQGAQVLIGGEIPQGKGFYYPPTILTNVKPGMPAFDEELFGPVISIIEAKDEAQAIQLANQSNYGLGGAVFTRDLARGEHIATYEIETGTCFVNGFVVSDPRVPFGGIKYSGYGRELSREGILEFVNTKTVGVQ
jgi:succinate-semialdehyde dehydrogenase/glutarate-semialdehyde dehydrogenase